MEQLNLFATPFNGLTHTNLGDTVYFKPALEDGKKSGPIWPAIIHKIWPASNRPTDGVAGLTIFTDRGPERMNYVRYGMEEGQWRRKEDGFTEKDSL